MGKTSNFNCLTNSNTNYLRIIDCYHCSQEFVIRPLKSILGESWSEDGFFLVWFFGIEESTLKSIEKWLWLWTYCLRHLNVPCTWAWRLKLTARPSQSKVWKMTWVVIPIYQYLSLEIKHTSFNRMNRAVHLTPTTFQILSVPATIKLWNTSCAHQ